MSQKRVCREPFCGLLPDPATHNIAREGRHFLHVHAYNEEGRQRVSIRIFKLVMIRQINKRVWAEIT